jgi:predicted RNase H-like HicB family nuclease
MKEKEVIDLTYGAKIAPDGDGYLVTLRDIENAFTAGETRDEAIFNAQEVLDLMLFASMYKPRSVNAGGSFTLPPLASPNISSYFYCNNK